VALFYSGGYNAVVAKLDPIAATLLEPVSSELDETCWTDASFQWLIYASHEDTVTIAAAELLGGLRAAWPSWRDFIPYWEKRRRWRWRRW
jgi:hypothetical protein